MINAYAHDAGRLVARPVALDAPAPGDAIWFDALAPDAGEVAWLEDRLGVTVPSRADMEEIEASSRVYTRNGTTFMTAVLPAGADRDHPEMAPVTFALSGDTLITLRYHDPRPFRSFPLHAETFPGGCDSGEAVLFGLLEEIVDRLADVLERASLEIDTVSHTVFRRPDPGGDGRQDFRRLLEGIGAKGDLLSNMRYALITIERLVGFLGQLTLQRKSEKALRAHVKSLTRDARSLIDHAGYLTQKVNFLLEATLGMINIEQNAIIKIFSVAAVAFLPPTLIASVYGMNFEVMPELGWSLGYPAALALMVVSAIVPLWYFKRRGWL